jgi:hypothetical protein
MAQMGFVMIQQKKINHYAYRIGQIKGVLATCTDSELRDKINEVIRKCEKEQEEINDEMA